MSIKYLIDASNWTYKFLSVYHVRRSINGVGINISTIYGWLRALKALPFDDVYICLDGYPSLSKTWLPGYKGQRSKEPEDEVFVSKFEMIQFLTQVGRVLGKNIQVLCTPGQEADQVISSAAHLLRGEVTMDQMFDSMFNNSLCSMEDDRMLKWFSKGAKMEPATLGQASTVIVGTTDSDMYQLQAIKDVYIDTSLSGQMINYEGHTPKAVHELPPNIIPSYKMFVGDISDNVPKITVPKGVDLIAIAKTFDTDQKRRDFLKSFRKNECPYSGGMKVLWEYLKKSGQYQQLSINYKVTHLEYYSTPFILTYPSYNIKDTIKKYKLRVK